MKPVPNDHAVKPNGVQIEPGHCAYEMSQSRLGTTWHYCNRSAVMRCIIQHGGLDGELRLEDYCMKHYRDAKRRTRYDVIIGDYEIPAGERID